MFAFLNHTHEANVAVYTPDEQMKRAEIFRRTREIEGTLQRHTSRLAAAHGGVGRAQRRRISRTGPCCSPTVDDISTGGERYLPMKDGSLLAQGYAPTKHNVKITVKTDVRNITRLPAGTADRPESAAGRPGPVDEGTAR